MKKILKDSLSCTTWITTLAFGMATINFYDISYLFPSSIIKYLNSSSTLNVDYIGCLAGKTLCFMVVFVAIMLCHIGWLKIFRKIVIEGKNYRIAVEVGDLFAQKDCQRVINFDECYTTVVGASPEVIKASSVCGQYLSRQPNLDIKNLIMESGLKPLENGSRFRNRNRFEPGSVVVNGDDLLMAFAKLDEDGKGHFESREEYLRCLEKMWHEIYKHYNHKDVCIPVLGAGLLNFKGGSGLQPSPQEFLDMIIHSYKLSCYKVKAPNKLRIICRKEDGISIEDIDSNYDLF